MKAAITLACLLACSAAQAATITLAPVGCTGSNYVDCKDPAPGVTLISFSVYQSDVKATVNGVVYDSGSTVPIMVDATFQVHAVVYGTDGSQLTLDVLMKHWLTYVQSGRGRIIVHHYALLSGTLQ
jgi:hypothetical protein